MKTTVKRTVKGKVIEIKKVVVRAMVRAGNGRGSGSERVIQRRID
jgi:hypothetical protein